MTINCDVAMYKRTPCCVVVFLQCPKRRNFMKQTTAFEMIASFDSPAEIDLNLAN